jgi:hypothetical protein
MEIKKDGDQDLGDGKICGNQNFGNKKICGHKKWW